MTSSVQHSTRVQLRWRDLDTLGPHHDVHVLVVAAHLGVVVEVDVDQDKCPGHIGPVQQPSEQR